MKIPQLQAPICAAAASQAGSRTPQSNGDKRTLTCAFRLLLWPRDCEPKGDGDNCTSGLAFSLQNLHHELLSRRSLLPGQQDRTLWNSREEAQNTQKTRRIVVQATYSVVGVKDWPC